MTCLQTLSFCPVRAIRPSVLLLIYPLKLDTTLTYLAVYPKNLLELSQ